MPRELVYLWDSWDNKVVSKLFSSLRKFYAGVFMQTSKGEDLSSVKTPLDDFERSYPAETQALVNAMSSLTDVTVYRALVFEQARDVFIDVANSDESDKALDVLTPQAELFPFDVVQPAFFVPWQGSVEVRRYSSWTDDPTVAQSFALAMSDSCAVVRASSAQVVFTPDAVSEFESYCLRRLKKAEPFFEKWKWQREFIVRSEEGHVRCDGAFLSSDYGTNDWDDFMRVVEWKRSQG